MICHLADAFRVASGIKQARPVANPFARTFIRWVALHTPMPWPHGVPTVPEVEQGKGGTPPGDWQRDCAELQTLIHQFAERDKFGAHPIWGELGRREWLVWGYRHTDHHLRQFGV